MEKEIKEHENENTTQVSLLGRKYQSVFVTSFMSERGDKPTNNCYISYIELDNFGCWVVVDGNNGGIFQNKIASYIGETIIENFIANPTIDKKEIEKMLLTIHRRYRNMQKDEAQIEQDFSSCSIAMAVTDYAAVTFASIGNARYGVLRDNKIVKKSNDDTLAFLQYEAGNILYDEIRFRKDKNILTQRFGVDRAIKINVSNIFMLRPNDRILLYTQGAWENLDEEEIELISKTSERAGKFIGNLVKQMKKNCYLSLENYTLCTIYANRPLEIPMPISPKPLETKEVIENIKTKFQEKTEIISKKLIIAIAIILTLGVGIQLYKDIKKENDIKNIQLKSDIAKIEQQINNKLEEGKYNIQETKYSEAIVNYNDVKVLYAQLEPYKKVSEEQKNNLESILNTTISLNKAQELYVKGNTALEKNSFSEAEKNFNEALKTLENISLNEELKNNIKSNLEISSTLAQTQIIKEKADKLYISQAKDKQKESIELYRNIIPTYDKYGKISIYEEILKKINQYEEKNKIKEQPKKTVKTPVLPKYKGDREFREFKYYSSLISYENALKTANTPEKREYLKGKIEMNKQLLVAVELELKGDEYLEKGNKQKAKEYFEKALIENKKLESNKYMPKDRYKAIIYRLEEYKLSKLK